MLDWEKYGEAFRSVQHVFEDNELYTEVLFYAYKNHEYRVIAKKEFRVDFILQLLKHRMLKSVTWK